MDAVEYLLAQNSYRKYLEQRMVQVNIPMFLPSRKVSLAITPGQGPYAWIIYRVLFGEAMIPHQFSVKLERMGGSIFGGIVSGQMIEKPFDTFSLTPRGAWLNIYIDNLRNVVGYFELSFFYLEIQSEEDYNNVLADIAGMVAPPLAPAPKGGAG